MQPFKMFSKLANQFSASESRRLIVFLNQHPLFWSALENINNKEEFRAIISNNVNLWNPKDFWLIESGKVNLIGKETSLIKLSQDETMRAERVSKHLVLGDKPVLNLIDAGLVAILFAYEIEQPDNEMNIFSDLINRKEIHIDEIERWLPVLICGYGFADGKLTYLKNLLPILPVEKIYKVLTSIILSYNNDFESQIHLISKVNKLLSFEEKINLIRYLEYIGEHEISTKLAEIENDSSDFSIESIDFKKNVGFEDISRLFGKVSLYEQLNKKEDALEYIENIERKLQEITAALAIKRGQVNGESIIEKRDEWSQLFLEVSANTEMILKTPGQLEKETNPFILLAAAEKHFFDDEINEAKRLSKIAVELLHEKSILAAVQNPPRYFSEWNLEERLQILLKLGLIEEAKRIGELFLKIFPNRGNLVELLGDICSESGDNLRALDHFHISDTLNNKNPSINKKLAKQYAKLDDQEKAFNYWVSYIESQEIIDDCDWEEYLSAAYENGQYETAITGCTESLSRNPNNYVANVVLGKSLLEMDRINDALAPLNKAAIINPGDKEVWLALADTFTAAGNRSKVIEVLRNGVISVPDSAELNIKLAHENYQDGFKQESLQYLEKAAILAPDSKEVVLLLANNLRELGHLEEEIIVMKDASKKWPDDTNLDFRLAKAYIESSNYKNALIPLRKVVEMGMPTKEQLLLYATVLLEGKNPLLITGTKENAQLYSARSSIEQVLIIDPNYFPARVLMAELLAAIGDFDTASGIYKNLIELPIGKEDDWKSRIKGGMGFCAFHLKNFDGAIVALKDALSSNPTNVWLNKLLASAYIEQKLFEDALNVAKKLMKYLPNDQELMMWFAEIARKTNKLSDAVQAINCALEISPECIQSKIKLAELKSMQSDLNGLEEVFQDLENHSDMGLPEYRKLAEISLGNAQYVKSIKFLKKCINAGGEKDPSIYSDISQLLVLSNSFDEALTYSKKATDLLNDDSNLFIRQADILTHLSRPKAALSVLEHAKKFISYKFVNSQTENEIHTIFEKYSNLIQRKWVDFSSVEASIYMRMASLYRLLGENVLALDNAKIVLNKFPENHLVRLFVINTSRQMGEIDQEEIISYWDGKFITQETVDQLTTTDNEDLWVRINSLQIEHFLDRNELGNAEDLFQEIKNREMGHSRYLAIKARIEGLNGFYQKAQETIQNAFFRYKVQLDEEKKNEGYLLVNSYDEAGEYWLTDAAIDTRSWDLVISSFIKDQENDKESQNKFGVFKRACALIKTEEFQVMANELDVVQNSPGDYYTDSENYEKVKKLLKGFRQNSPLVKIWALRNKCLFSNEEENCLEMERYIRNSNDAAAFIRVLRRNGQIESAIKFAEGWPENDQINIQLTMCYLAIDDEKGITLSERLVENRPEDPICHILNAYSMVAKDGLKAVNAIERAIEIWPDETKWHTVAADLNKNNKQIKKRIDHLEKAAGLQNNSDQITEMLGDAYFEYENYDQAIKSYKNICEKNSDNKIVLMKIANAYKALGKLKQSLDHAVKAEGIEPYESTVDVFISQVFSEMGDLSKAEIYAQKAVDADGDSEQNVINLLNVLIDQKKFNKAISVIEKSISDISKSDQLLLKRIKIIRLAKGTKAALPYLEEFIKGKPGNTEGQVLF
ncbi:MAG: tetratricopeptide repeat protein, partial [Bacteroidales bacterium]|nr:tetratricopeptide repeat protein [Bacteroidales bacterium]